MGRDDESAETLEAFLEETVPASDPRSREAWRASLERWCEEGQATFEGVRGTSVDLARHLEVRIRGGETPEGLRGTELFLASSAARGDGAARAALGRWLDDVMDRALTRFRAPAAALADVRQQVREHVLVGRKGRPPAIAQYGGRGSLEGWLRVTAVRTCLNALDATGRSRATQDEELLAALPSPLRDPEMAHLKQTYRAEFVKAFAEAVEALPDRERTLLRQHHVDHLHPADLGTLYQVHRTTALRWLQQAQERLVKETRRAMQRRLGASPEEVESIIRLLSSQLDMSVHRYL